MTKCSRAVPGSLWIGLAGRRPPQTRHKRSLGAHRPGISYSFARYSALSKMLARVVPRSIVLARGARTYTSSAREGSVATSKEFGYARLLSRMLEVLMGCRTF